MDTVSKGILETLGAAGFVVTVDANQVTAIDNETGERFIVRYAAEGFYAAVVELALQVGIELETVKASASFAWVADNSARDVCHAAYVFRKIRKCPLPPPFFS